MEGEAAAEFQDWELLVHSDSDQDNSPNSAVEARNFEEIEADSEGLIRLDYFSLENDNRYAKTVVDAREEGSVQSDNPSWIDPGSETRCKGGNSGELLSDSGSDRPDDGKICDYDGTKDLGFVENAESKVVLDRIGGIDGADGREGKFKSLEGKLNDFDWKSEMELDENVNGRVGFGGFGETQNKDMDFAKLWSDSGGEAPKVNEGSKVLDDSDGENASIKENAGVVAVEENKPDGKEVKRKVAWWKVPFEVLKYCVFRVNPVWSFSMAAAVMGFVILGRTLYKMKRRTQSLQIKVTVDDDKVMSRAARLNEAFSMVRRVPVVRPLLPAAGVNPWPVISLR